MEWTFFIEQLKQIIQPLDTLSILMTFFLSQRLKVFVPKNQRPATAIIVGLLVACGWALKDGGWNQVLGYGFLYGAGAIGLYMLGLERLVRKLPGGRKAMG